MKYIMALDQGTTSSRCILFDHNGNICSSVQKEFTQIYPQPGWVEHDAEEIYRNVVDGIRELLANEPDLTTSSPIVSLKCPFSNASITWLSFSLAQFKR